MEKAIQEAVSICLAPGLHPEPVRSKAFAFCENFKQNPDAIATCVSLLLSKPSASWEVKFFSLSVLQTAAEEKRFSASSERLDHLIKEILLAQVALSIQEAPNYVVNKFCSLLAIIVFESYPIQLPMLLKNLLDWSRHSAWHAELYVRTYLALHDEVFSLLVTSNDPSVVERVTALKDAMRVSDIAAAFDRWMQLFCADGTPVRGLEVLISVLGSFSEWIDASLYQSGLFANRLASLWSEGNADKEVIVKCLQVVASKGMPASAKLFHLERIGIFSLVSESDLLLNCAGLELCLAAADERDASVREVLMRKILALLPLLARQNQQLALLLPFIGNLIDCWKVFIKKNHPFPAEFKEFAIYLLHKLPELVKVSDEESDLERARVDVIISLTGLHSIIDAATVEESLFGWLQRNLLQSSNPVDWDASLFVIERFHEIFAGSETRERVVQKVFSLLLAACKTILGSGDSGLSQQGGSLKRSSALLLLDSLVRFGKPDRLPAAESKGADAPFQVSFLLQSVATYLPVDRNRVGLAFLKLVRNYREHLVQDQQLCENLAHALIPYLVIDSSLDFAGTIYIYEVLGTILVRCRQPDHLVKNILSVIYSNAHQLSSTGAESDERYFCNAFVAVGTLVKAISDPTQFPWLSEYLAGFLSFMLTAVRHKPGSEALRKSTLFAFQRISLAVGFFASIEQVLELSSIFITVASVGELAEFLSFACSILHHWQSEIVSNTNSIPFLRSLLARATFLLFPAEKPTGTDDLHQLVALRNAFLSFSQALFNVRLQDTFFRFEKDNFLREFLVAVTQLALDWSDPSLQKSAVSVFLRCCNAWVPIAGASDISAFDSVLIQGVLDCLTKMMAHKGFKYRDGLYSLILNDICLIFICIVQRLPQQGSNWIYHFLTNLTAGSSQPNLNQLERLSGFLRAGNSRSSKLELISLFFSPGCISPNSQ